MPKLKYQTNLMESAGSLIQQNELGEDGIDITFERITYTVQIPVEKQGLSLPCSKETKDKVIIDNVSGIFKAGKVTAIMGASGAGKTTLLNIIAGRVDKFEGNLYANATPYTFDNFGDFANYVMQSDVLMQTLTVRETLNFAASMRINGTEEQKKILVDEITKKMKLEKCIDTLVGGTLVKGISGGEKKRTSIAFQLMSNPKVIILDEPTSGLDSLTSFIIVNELRELAHKFQKTVIMTIHQPNSDIFNLFDNLTLMIEGKLIYQGNAFQALDYFEVHFGLKSPQFENPADYFIAKMHHEDQTNVDRYPKYFSCYNEKLSHEISKSIQNRSKRQIVKRVSEIPLKETLKTLIHRDYINTMRNPLLMGARIFMVLFMSIYLGGLYFSGGRIPYTNSRNDPTGVAWTTITGLMFFITINQFFDSLMPVTIVFPLQRLVFLKEENAKMYGVIPYFISRNIIDIPYLVIFPMIFSLIVYWMVGLAATAQQFFVFYFIVFLLVFTASSFGLLTGCMISDVKVINAVVPLVALPMILFSGLFKNTTNIPDWIGWIQYISPLKYTFIALIDNEVKYKDSYADTLGFDLSQWASIGILIGLGITMRFVACFFLWALRSKLQ